jgi:hypothetical protein
MIAYTSLPEASSSLSADSLVMIETISSPPLRYYIWTPFRLVAGSNPAEPTSEANSPINPLYFYKNAQVQPPVSDFLQLRELMYILLGNKGRRH